MDTLCLGFGLHYIQCPCRYRYDSVSLRLTIMKKISFKILPILAIFVFSTVSVFAQTGGTGTTGGTGGSGSGSGTDGGNINIPIELKNPFSGGNSLFGLLEKVVNEILLPIGGILAVLAFIYSGFLFVTAQGNETKLKTAKTALLYTAIGTALLLGAWVFAKAICGTIEAISSNPNICL